MDKPTDPDFLEIKAMFDKAALLLLAKAEAEAWGGNFNYKPGDTIKIVMPKGFTSQDPERGRPG